MAIALNPALAPIPAQAQQTAAPAPAPTAQTTKPAVKATPQLRMELNSLKTVGQNCRVGFVIRNDMGAPISHLMFELVLFDRRERIIQLLVIDAGRLPRAKTRVRQFDLRGLPCDDIGRALLNDITKCGKPPLNALKCLDATAVSSRTGVPFEL
ncbi:MAG: hypothetical protein AAFR04_09865 [Pseudomonadota bacterium]